MAIVAGLVAAFSVFCTSGAQDFAFNQSARTGEAQAVEAEAMKARVQSLSADVTRLDSEATALQASKAGQAIADMARYRSTVATIDSRLDAIAKAKGEKLDEIDRATKSLATSTTGRKINLYSYYAGTLGLPEGTLALLVHFFMSLVLAGAGPIGILALGDTKKKKRSAYHPPMSKQRRAIIAALAEKPLRPQEIATALGKNPATCRVELRNMREAGLLRKDETTGTYAAINAI
jgi:cell division protein FtsB